MIYSYITQLPLPAPTLSDSDLEIGEIDIPDNINKAGEDLVKPEDIMYQLKPGGSPDPGSKPKRFGTMLS